MQSGDSWLNNCIKGDLELPLSWTRVKNVTLLRKGQTTLGYINSSKAWEMHKVSFLLTLDWRELSWELQPVTDTAQQSRSGSAGEMLEEGGAATPKVWGTWQTRKQWRKWGCLTYRRQDVKEEKRKKKPTVMHKGCSKEGNSLSVQQRKDKK